MAATGKGWATLVGLAVLAVLAYSVLMFVRTQDVMMLLLPLYGAGVILAVAAAFHVLLRDDLTGTQRIIWLLIVVFVNPGIPVGAPAYFILGRVRTRTLFRDVRVGDDAPPPPPGDEPQR